MRTSIADHLRRISQEADPQDLFRQVRPMLSRMKLHNLVERRKTALESYPDRTGEAVYRVTIRRNDKIEDDQIAGINREVESFEGLMWTNDGMVAYVKAPYEAPPAEEPGTPEGPAPATP